jgi:hypothetical protein
VRNRQIILPLSLNLTSFQTDSRHSPRRVHVPRDDVDMEEQRSGDYFQDQVRKVSRAAHRQGYQGQRRPQCDEPRTGITATAHVAVCLRSKRPRSATHKPGCTTPESIPAIRRDGAEYLDPTIAQLLCTPSISTASQPPVCAYRIHSIIAQ